MDEITHACIRDIVTLAKQGKTPKQVTAELRRRGYSFETARTALEYCTETLKE